MNTKSLDSQSLHDADIEMEIWSAGEGESYVYTNSSANGPGVEEEIRAGRGIHPGWRHPRVAVQDTQEASRDAQAELQKDCGGPRSTKER